MHAKHPTQQNSMCAINMTCGWPTPIVFHLYLIVELCTDALDHVAFPFVHKAK